MAFDAKKTLGQLAAAKVSDAAEGTLERIGHVSPLTLYRLLKFSYKEHSNSTCVADVNYNPITQEMVIVFQQRGTYKYHDVPLDTYVDFESAGSRGTYFNLYIRPQFSYERIE